MTTVVFRSYDRREWPSIALLIFVILSIASYIYLTHRVVFYAVGGQVARREIAVLTDQVTKLEARTFTLGNRLTLDLAYALGFRDSGDQTFYTATRETAPLLVSWRNDGHE